MDALAQFCAAIARAGLPVPETVTADGALHRFSTNGKARDESGWYVLHLDGVPAGAFGCWRSGLSETWCERERSQMSDDEYHELIRRMEQAKQQREADREQQHLAAAGTAVHRWEAAQPAPATHPYLVRKQIRPHGIRSDGDTLVIPMYDGAGQLCSLQYINGDGEKRFLSGGRVAGCYYAIDGDRATVYVAEGFATAASIAEASGAAVAVCFTAGQLLAVARLMREKFPTARRVIAADNDVRDDGSENTGLEKATEAATLTEALLAVPELEGTKCDFNDVHVARGPDAVRQQLGRAALTEQTVLDRELRRLLDLGPISYDKERRTVAKRLGVRAGAIDKEIESRRQQTVEAKERQVAKELFPPIDPYDGEVNGHELIEALRRQIRRYVVMDKHAVTAAAVWVIHTHAVGAAVIAPILLVISPVKRCGKSTFRDVLTPLVYRGLPADNISTAVVYRAMEEFHPTLMIDEADSFLDENEEMRGVINAGHRRGAKTMRVGGVNRDQIEVFDPFGPKLIAGIGRRRDTIEDRAIIVKLRRRKADESVEAVRLDRLDNRQLQSFCAAWARDNLVALTAADPPVPESLHDRAADNWRPLLAIADLCGVGADAREAAKTFSGEDTPTESAGVMLLEDLRQMFAEKETDRLSSASVVELLNGMEERPWPEWRNGKAITSRQVAGLLEPFGVTPRTIRFETSRGKGYLLDSFTDLFERYLVKTASGSVTAGQPYKNRHLDENPSVTTPNVSRIEKREKPYENRDCHGVTDKSAGREGNARDIPGKEGAKPGIRCRDCQFYDTSGAAYCVKLDLDVHPDVLHHCPDFRVPT